LEEEEFYRVVEAWLRLQGYDPVIAGAKKQKRMILVSVASLLPGRLFVEPDVVGLRDDSRLAAIEVKTNRKETREALGQCLIYTAAADDVYLALTEDLCQEIRSLELFESLGIGLLSLCRTRRKGIISIDESARGRITSAQDPGDVRLSTGWWRAERKLAPRANSNLCEELHRQLLTQTKRALGRNRNMHGISGRPTPTS
jgi:hypothetical protein